MYWWQLIFYYDFWGNNSGQIIWIALILSVRITSDIIPQCSEAKRSGCSYAHSFICFKQFISIYNTNTYWGPLPEESCHHHFEKVWSFVRKIKSEWLCIKIYRFVEEGQRKEEWGREGYLDYRFSRRMRTF